MQKLLALFVLAFVLAVVALATGCGGQASATGAMVSPSPMPQASPTPANGPPDNAKTLANIQKLGGWENCTGSCTSTAPAVFSLTQGVASPSQSGASARFELLPGTQPFGAALWFKFLTTDSSATHFIYDLLFFIDNPAAPQALEFNVSQSTGGNRYNFATQCDFATRAWRVWEPAALKWVSSSAGCAQPQANTWNHLVWEFERDPAGNTVFTAVTQNGARSVVNIKVGHVSDSSNGIDVAFQPDANGSPVLYSVWLDKITLTYW